MRNTDAVLTMTFFPESDNISLEGDKPNVEQQFSVFGFTVTLIIYHISYAYLCISDKSGIECIVMLSIYDLNRLMWKRKRRNDLEIMNFKLFSLKVFDVHIKIDLLREFSLDVIFYVQVFKGMSG